MTSDKVQKTSLNTQMIVMRKELKGRGTPKETFMMTGNIPDHEPAGKRYLG
jgi:hypothetical protein